MTDGSAPGLAALLAWPAAALAIWLPGGKQPSAYGEHLAQRDYLVALLVVLYPPARRWRWHAANCQQLAAAMAFNTDHAAAAPYLPSSATANSKTRRPVAAIT